MSPVVRVAHDFNCPWCWIAVSQARRLRADFGVRIEWAGYEIHPEGVEFAEPRGFKFGVPNRPPTPDRLGLAYAAEGMEPPTSPPPKTMRTHNAHEAVEYARTVSAANELVERLYRAAWTEGKDVNQFETIADAARGVVPDVEAMLKAVRERRFADRIVPFDDPAYRTGVYNVPTFFIGGKRYAEQPYAVLAKAARALVADEGRPQGAYGHLELPAPPDDRPYVAIGMVITLDGKTVTGERTEPSGDLGSEVDHATMRQIEAAADGVLIGAGSLRSTPKLWYDARLWRFVATESGKVDPSLRFFTDAPERAFAVVSESAEGRLLQGVRALVAGAERLDLAGALRRMRAEFGVHRLVAEGGSELNAALLREGLVDELFLTLAPKVKLGAGTPTLAGGEPLPREALLRFALVSERRVGDELFLRYRRR